MGIKEKLKKPLFWAKTGAAVCAAALLLMTPNGIISKNASGSSSIKDIQERIDKIQKENAERRDQIDKYEGDISDNEAAMDTVSELIDGFNSEIALKGELIIGKQGEIDAKKLEIKAVEERIADREKEIDRKKAEISEMQAENKRNLQKFAKLANALYKTDPSGMLPVLNGSRDWYNYYVYSDVVENISGQNLGFMKALMASIDEQEKKIDDLNKEIDGLEQDKTALNKQKEALEGDMTELEGEKSELEGYAMEQKGYLSGLAANNEWLKDKVDGLNYDISASNRELDELDKELQELIRRAQENGSGSDVAYTDGFRWPLAPQFHNITTYFGYDNNFGGRNHGGIDVIGYGVPVGSANIYAAQSGRVIKVSNTCSHDYGKYYSCGCGGGWGNYVVVDHGGGLSTLYAHCRAIYVSEGQYVTKGDVIAIVGCTGWSTGDHLHFEVREDGYRVDPFKYTYQDVY